MSTPPFRVDGPAGAPLLVLGNSLGTDAALWTAQMPALTARFRVVRYEHPGHGGTPTPSPAPATIADLGAGVIEVLDALGAASASLAGISLGGMVAMWVAAHHPDRVERLVLGCTAAHLPPASGWLERAAEVRASGPAVLLDRLMARWFTAGYEQRDPGARPLVAAMLGATDAEGYAACCEAIAAMDQRADVAAIEAPTLVIAGAGDPVTPPAMALELASSIPGAALVVLPGAAHLANIEATGAFTAAMVDHLAGTASARGERVRRAVLGDAHVDRSAAAAAPGSLRAPFADFITRTAWGDIWSRPALDRPTRSAITLAALTALGAWDELALHVPAAVRNGLTPGDIGEILLHTAIYAGVPAANTALAVAERALAERSLEEDGGG